MGKLTAMPQLAARRWAESLLTDRNLAIAEEVAGVAAQLGATAVAAAWAAVQCGITCVIIGLRNQDQLRQNLAGFSLEVPAGMAAGLTEVSGPAGRSGRSG